MRERLIELLRLGGNVFMEDDDYEDYEDENEFIADYLIANGVIVPPCKVGDTVYCVYYEMVIKGTVRLIRPFILESETIFKGNIICEIDSPFVDGEKEEIELFVVFEQPCGIERVAYLTREEAEKALKEREGKCQKY